MKNLLILIILLTSLTSCWPIAFLVDDEPNRFLLNRQPFTYFGKYSGYGDYDKECKKLNPPHPIYFADELMRYKNDVPASRTCVSYQRYLCRVNITCPKHQNPKEKKKCERDAESYFLRSWHDIKTGKLLDSRTATKEICESEKKQCDSAPKGDYSCRK